MLLLLLLLLLLELLTQLLLMPLLTLELRQGCLARWLARQHWYSA